MSRRRAIARVGRALASSTQGGVFGWALAAASLAMVITCVGLVVIVGSYEGRAQRDAARTPVVSTAEQATVWQHLQTEAMGREYVDVLYIVPLRSDAPLPPGLREWPSPGQVVMSEAVAASQDGRALADRLGEAAPERVDESGLGDPRERLIYARPVDSANIAWGEGEYASGYGVPHGIDGGTAGSALRAKPVWVFLATFGLLVGVPSVVLVVLACRVGSPLRDRRMATLRVMGARPRDRALVLLSSAWKSIVAGVAVGCAITAFYMVRNTRVPGTDYVISHRDVTDRLPGVLAAVVLAIAVVVLLLVVLNNRSLARANRPTPRVRPVSLWMLLVAPSVIAVSGWAYEQATPMGPNVTTLIYYVGVFCTVLSLPLFVAAVVQLAARGIHRLGRRTGQASAIASGRQLLAEPRALLRLAAALSIVIVLAVQVQVFSTKLSAQMIDAQRLEARTGDTVATIDVRGDDPTVLSVLQAAQRYGDIVVVAGSADPDVPTEVVATCPVLKEVGLDCTPGSPQALSGGVVTGLRALGDLVGSSSVVVRVADPTRAVVAPAGANGWTTTLLARADGGPLPIGEISDALAPTAVPAPRVETLAQSWLVAADDLQVKGRWITTFGTYAVAAAALALAAAAAAEFARMGLSTALWAAMGARRRVYVAMSAWRILLPMLVASAVGFTAAAWLAKPLLAPAEGGHLSTTAVLAELAVVGTVSIGVWLLSARHLLRDARRWRPATD